MTEDELVEAMTKAATSERRDHPYPMRAALAVARPIIAQEAREEAGENVSDGFHTFKELYQYRMLYNAALFNQWSNHRLYDVHKSTKHANGEDCFGGGWFVVMATLPTGQISNHYAMEYWHLFHIHTRVKAAPWDRHTPQDAADRILALLSSPTNCAPIFTVEYF